MLLARASLLLLVALSSPAGAAAPAAGLDASAYLESVRSDPARLERFLRKMPKGGDLHTHLWGVPAAETFLAWGAADGLCIDPGSSATSSAPCAPGTRPMADVARDPAAAAVAIDAFSMRNAPLSPPRFGHDHFFSTFALFDPVAMRRVGDAFADAAQRASRDGTQYLELLHTIQGPATAALATTVPWTGEIEPAYRAMLPGIRALASAGSAELDRAFARQRALLRCDTPMPDPACAVTLRVIQQVVRLGRPAEVLAALMLGAEMAERDGRVLSVDLVAPEDAPPSLAGYRLHMKMLAFLRGRYPSLRVALHAGELNGALVPPEELTYHVTEAVRVAGASRIGHGVSVRSEPGWNELLAAMARDRVAVSIQLTSNAEILGVSGADHPFRAYLAAGVPLVLSTDDQGVSRGSHTREFVRAVAEQRLSYAELRWLVRNSIELSFLPGADLWAVPGDHARLAPACARDLPGGGYPSPTCDAFLRASDRAAEQWRLEARLAAFESGRWD